MEHCIIYFSASASLLREADLLTLLEQSRHDNAKAGITGILLFDRGSIVQVIEGEKEAIEALFGRIERDYRHTNVTKVFDGPISQRLFADWNMGYRTITTHQLDIVKSVLDLYKTEWLSVKPSNTVILQMLKVFYEGNAR